VATLADRLLALAQAIGADIKSLTASVAALKSDPWTRVKLASDFTTALATFVNITGMTYTPPATSDFIIEAELLLWTTTTTTLPRIGVALPAGMQYAAVEIVQAGATDTTQVVQEGGTTTAAATVQVPAGGLAVASVPRMCRVVIKGKSGANPTAVTLQLAAEIAGANVCFVKAGSEMRSRVIA
jgi:hypothetical protein